MRSIRALATAMALVAVLPVIAAAQSARPFKNSWFWGAKGGTFLFSTPTTTNAMAPSGGIDWLITRSRAGLYVGFSQSFFNRYEFIQAEGDTTRAVALRNMRRVDLAAMIFPGKSTFFKPYAGLGFAMQQIASAEPEGTFISPDQFQTAHNLVSELRTSWTPLFMAGAQVQLPGFSVFFQGSASSSQASSFLHGTNAFNYAGEAGLRFNFGSSIDRN